MAAARAAKSEMMMVALMVMWVTDIDYFFSDLNEQLLPYAPLPRFLYPLSHGHGGIKRRKWGIEQHKIL